MAMNNADATRIREIHNWIEKKNLQNEPREEDLKLLQDMIDHSLAEYEQTLRALCPALHFSLDDSDGKAILTVTPTLNVRFSDDIERVQMIDERWMEVPEMQRTLGRRASGVIESIFTLSQVVKDCGLAGITPIIEGHALSDAVAEAALEDSETPSCG
jgi:hypothetical protein